MAESVIYLKLGGSLITDKNQPYVVEQSTLDRISSEISRFLCENPNKKADHWAWIRLVWTYKCYQIPYSSGSHNEGRMDRFSESMFRCPFIKPVSDAIPSEGECSCCLLSPFRTGYSIKSCHPKMGYINYTNMFLSIILYRSSLGIRCWIHLSAEPSYPLKSYLSI